MSDTAEDLIVLSPCAPSRTMNTSTTSPAAPVHDLDFTTEASLQSSRASQRSFETTMACGAFVGKEVACDDKEQTAKKTVEKPVKITDSASIIQKQHGSVVIIKPLPKSITKRDILCRVCGGKVLSCILSELHGCILAAVTFQDPASAQHYVEFCAETSNKELWSFDSGLDLESPSQVDMTPRVYVYTDAPGLGTTWCPEDIPSSPKAYPASVTRCLFLEDCHIERVSKLWVELGLNRSEHLRNQLDDMWLDLSDGADASGKAFGTLHIWYSDINIAMQAQQRCPGLKYETDPCSTSLQESFFSGYDHTRESTGDGAQDVPKKHHIRYHSFPFVSLLDLHKKSVMDGLSRGLLDPYEVFGCIRTPESEEEDIRSMNLTERLMHALRKHGKEQRKKRRGDNKTKVSYLLDLTLSTKARAATDALEPPGYVVHSTAGNDDPFSDDQQGPTTSTIRMSSASAEPPQRNSALHGVTRPPFGMARPQAGYRLQFPPPMSGEPAIVEHPSMLDQSSSLGRPIQTRLTHRLQKIVYPGSLPLPSPSVVPSRSTEDTTGCQNGRSDGSRCSSSGALNTQTQAYTDARVEPSNTANSAYSSSSTSRSASASFVAPDHDENTARVADVSHLQSTGSSKSTAVSSDEIGTARGCDPPESATTSPPTGTVPNYSRENSDDASSNDVFWTVSIEEFRAMNDDQWKAFGTSFYIPPPGFNTAKRHVVKLKLSHAPSSPPTASMGESFSPTEE